MEIGLAGAGPRVEMLAELLTRAGQRAVVWSPEGDVGELEGAQVVDGAQALAERARVILVAPAAKEMRVVAQSLGPYIQGYHHLVHTTHHLEPTTGCRGSEILRQETVTRQIGALVGPTEEGGALGQKPGAAVVGSRFPATVKVVQEALSSPLFRVYGNMDLVGVELGGAMSNLLSVSIGVADALEFGPGIRGTLCARGVAEMGRLGVAFGAKEKTFAGMSGLGYLVSLITDGERAPHQMGKALALGQSLEQLEERFGSYVADLAVSAGELVSLAEQRGVQAHILDQVWKMLTAQSTTAEALRALLGLGQMME